MLLRKSHEIYASKKQKIYTEGKLNYDTRLPFHKWLKNNKFNNIKINFFIIIFKSVFLRFFILMVKFKRYSLDYIDIYSSKNIYFIIFQ